MPLYVEMDFSELDAAMNNLESAFASGPRDADIFQGIQTALDIDDGYQRRQFASASAGDGRWPDIADSTKAKRMRQSGAPAGVKVPDAPFTFPVLYISGDLYTSLVRGSPGHFSATTDNSVSSGTEVFHAHFHQVPEGDREPQRIIIDYPDEATLESMVGAIREGVAAAVAKAVQ